MRRRKKNTARRKLCAPAKKAMCYEALPLIMAAMRIE